MPLHFLFLQRALQFHNVTDVVNRCPLHPDSPPNWTILMMAGHRSLHNLESNEIRNQPQIEMKAGKYYRSQFQ